MERRIIMKAINIGTIASLGLGTAQASEHYEKGDKEDADSDSGDGGQGYTPYGGNDTKTATDVGGFDHVLGYLAEGVVGGQNVAPGLPENRFADSQTEMPGFPEAFT